MRLDLSAGREVDATGLVITKRPRDLDLAFLLWLSEYSTGQNVGHEVDG